MGGQCAVFSVKISKVKLEQRIYKAVFRSIIVSLYVFTSIIHVLKQSRTVLSEASYPQAK